jgi:hypothetical protein
MKTKSNDVNRVFKRKSHKHGKTCPICNVHHNGICSPVWLLLGDTYEGLCYECLEEYGPDLMKKTHSIRDERFVARRKLLYNEDNAKILRFFFGDDCIGNPVV